MFRYKGFLPVVRVPRTAGRTVVYRSQGLARMLGLPNLWIAFNGYWPERGALLETATFKDLEAHAVLGRLPEQPMILTVASAGNTGAAFAWECSRAQVPCVLTVPARGLGRFKFKTELDPCVNLVVIEDGDYQDAIQLANAISRTSGFMAEGGARNVARRDGLGTVMLAAFEEINCLPSYYFQAVGSGAGAIAVLESARRLLRASADYEVPRMMLCQNQPFTPIYDAWKKGSKSLGRESADYFRDAVKQVSADELTNRMPPYGVTGGVYDCLAGSRGDVLTASNAAAKAASDAFMELEGIDIEPAAGVALACLGKAARQGRIPRESVVLLNVTGGGRLRLGAERELIAAEPRLRLTRESLARGGFESSLDQLGL